MSEKDCLYFKDGELIAEAGCARVYKLSDCLFLEYGTDHHLVASSDEVVDFVWQLAGKPRGDCLEVGLGLGVASKYILSCPKVRSLTTVEQFGDIIEVQKLVNPTDKEWSYHIPRMHSIINDEWLLYPFQSSKVFDFVFVNCYNRIDESTLPLIEDVVNAYRRLIASDGKMVCWFDRRTSESFVSDFYKIVNF